MGINIKNESWWEVVQKNREDDKQRVKKHGGTPRFPSAESFENTGNIKTTKIAEQNIAARSLKRNEKGNFVPITKRGRRRAERLAN